MDFSLSTRSFRSQSSSSLADEPMSSPPPSPPPSNGFSLGWPSQYPACSFGVTRAAHGQTEDRFALESVKNIFKDPPIVLSGLTSQSGIWPAGQAESGQQSQHSHESPVNIPLLDLLNLWRPPYSQELALRRPQNQRTNTAEGVSPIRRPTAPIQQQSSLRTTGSAFPATGLNGNAPPPSPLQAALRADPRFFHPMANKLRQSSNTADGLPTSPSGSDYDAAHKHMELAPPVSHYYGAQPDRVIQGHTMAGFSPNYKGNTNIVRNKSANIPDSENCSLFIMGLPPGLTTRDLLANIRGVGRIYATHINEPEPSRGHHTCAAKVIFFEREAAHRFWQLCQSQGGTFDVCGFPARVVWNRIKSAEQTEGPSDRSRVLLIRGPKEIINPVWLTEYFSTKIDFQVEGVETLTEDDGTALVEYRFGSFRSQSESAKMALAREHGDCVKAWYGRDPCACP